MAKTRFAKAFRKAFIVDDLFFTRVGDLYREYGESPTVTVRLSDDSSIEELSIEELLQLPNMSARKITGIDINNSYKAQPRIHLELRDVPLVDSVRYSIQGDDRSAKHVSGELDRLLANAVPWYSFILYPRRYRAMLPEPR